MSSPASKHPAIQLLSPDEPVHVVAEASDASLIVTDRRVAVAQAGRLALDVPFEGLRRIQFDIERRWDRAYEWISAERRTQVQP